MKSNFSFLRRYWPALAQIGEAAENYVYSLRKTRNDAVHAGADSVEDARALLQMAYNLSVWFMEVYGDWGYIADDSVMPEERAIPDYETIIKEQEEKIAELSCRIEQVTTAVSDKTTKKRIEQAETASESMELSEAETRYLIDEQLRRCGWEADTNNIRYSKCSRPQKGRNLAIMP